MVTHSIHYASQCLSHQGSNTGRQAPLDPAPPFNPTVVDLRWHLIEDGTSTRERRPPNPHYVVARQAGDRDLAATRKWSPWPFPLSREQFRQILP